MLIFFFFKSWNVKKENLFFFSFRYLLNEKEIYLNNKKKKKEKRSWIERTATTNPGDILNIFLSYTKKAQYCQKDIY